MSLEVAPVELEFRRPFNREVSQTIHLANRNETPVAFKVKTTAPKRYCVRPNSGRIEPGTVVEVQVLLQAMKEEPPLDQRCRDKFLVQSVAVPADKDFANVSAIWQHADAHRDQERPFECKIKVAFLPPLGDEAPDSRQSSDAAQRSFHDEPPAYSPAAQSPTAGHYATPANKRSAQHDAPSSTTATTGPAGGAPAAAPAPAIAVAPAPAEPAPRRVASGGSQGQAREAPASAPAPAAEQQQQLQSTVARLRSQLADSQSQIERLKDQLADQGLRQRKLPASASASGGGEREDGGAAQQLRQQGEGEDGGLSAAGLLQMSGEQGVPLNIVAVLCFVSFLLGYLFF